MGIETKDQKRTRMMAMLAWSMNPNALMNGFSDEEAATVCKTPWTEWSQELQEKMKPFMGEAIRQADEAAAQQA